MNVEDLGEVAGRLRCAEFGAEDRVGEVDIRADGFGTNCIDWEEERLKKGIDEGAGRLEVSGLAEKEGLGAFSPPVMVWYK